jgi:glycosyltransferase involved in cell wall biosynthesis
MDISVVIPLYNEEESLPELTDWIRRVMLTHNFSYEIILVDDGSKDSSWKVIMDLKKTHEQISGIKFRRNYGDVIITMDADLQDSPDEIPELYDRIMNQGADLVSGWKQKRYDPLTKTIPTKLFNSVTRSVSGIDNLHDFNCGLKAYKKDVVKSIEVYGEMHRYIPVIAKWAGFTNIQEQVVQHYPRKYGTTKFGPGRFVKGFLDLMSIFFVGKFGKRPMHFFGPVGVVSFLIGFFITIYLICEKLMSIANGTDYRNVTDQPLFFLSLLAIMIGTQLFLTGFIAELLSRNSSERNKYHIERVI